MSEPTVDVFSNPTIDDHFIVADDRELALRCGGQGSSLGRLHLVVQLGDFRGGMKHNGHLKEISDEL
jgi:hypothetical protein